jgi:probable rRNA maturation factor
MLTLNFENESNVDSVDTPFIALVEKACGLLSSHSGQVNFVLMDDEKIRILNRDFRQIDKATDVLSFPYESGEWPEEEEKLFGEIFISIDTAKRQAAEKGHSLERELEILFVHGLLHLMGFDHQNDEEENEMEAYAKKILE